MEPNTFIVDDLAERFCAKLVVEITEDASALLSPTTFGASGFGRFIWGELVSHDLPEVREVQLGPLCHVSYQEVRPDLPVQGLQTPRWEAKDAKEMHRSFGPRATTMPFLRKAPFASGN